MGQRWITAALGMIVLAVCLAGAARAQSQSIVIDPSRPLQRFEGFGTSLCWWANTVGQWANTTRFEQLMDLIFHPTLGLGLNQVRYNIGGQ